MEERTQEMENRGHLGMFIYKGIGERRSLNMLLGELLLPFFYDISCMMKQIKHGCFC